jgi:hypothetical protein
VEVGYHDVVHQPIGELPRFEPPEGVHVFREETLAVDDLIERAPFPVPLEPYGAHGLTPVARGILTIDDAGERAHGTLLLEGGPRGNGSDPPLLTLRFGNYVARDMARRNVTLSELGDAIEIAGNIVRLLDRRAVWEENVPGVDAARAPIEVSWKQDGVHWFAIAHGIDKDALRRMASSHLSGDPPPASDDPAS